MKPKISVIIPTLNEAASLEKTLDAIKNLCANIEIIVVDGGSGDATVAIAEFNRVKLLQSEPGRGTQLRAGAKSAVAEILWFLHADTIPTAERNY